MEKQLNQQLLNAVQSINAKIKICMKDGFEKNKIQIRHLTREKNLYNSFVERINKFESNILKQLAK